MCMAQFLEAGQLTCDHKALGALAEELRALDLPTDEALPLTRCQVGFVHAGEYAEVAAACAGRARG